MAASIVERFFTLCWNPQFRRGRDALCRTGLSVARTRTHRATSAGTTHNLSCSSGRPRCLPPQSRGVWPVPPPLPGTVSSALSAIGLAGQISMAAGDQACRQGEWLVLAELPGFLEGGGFLPRPRAFCCPNIQLAWEVVATPRAQCSLPALGTRRLTQPLTSGRFPSPGHMHLLPIPRTLPAKSGMSLPPCPTVSPLRLYSARSGPLLHVYGVNEYIKSEFPSWPGGSVGWSIVPYAKRLRV